MKRATGKIALALVAATCAATLAQCNRGAWSLVVPPEWYRLPEDGPAPPASDPSVAGALAQSLGSMLDIQGTAIANLSPGQSAGAGDCPGAAPLPSDWVPWHPGAVMTDFSLTVDGLLSPLLFEGTAILETIWRPAVLVPASASASASPALRARHTPPDLLIRGATPAPSESDIAAELEPAIRGAIATGRITDEAALRKNLVSAGMAFARLAEKLGSIHLEGVTWSPNTFRLEVPVTASGMISPLLSIGVALLFRFDWEKGDDPLAAAPAASPDSQGAGPDPVADFVQALATDLDAGLATSAGGPELSGYPLETIRIGAGLTAGGTIGIATVSAQAVGSFEFDRVGAPSRRAQSAALPTPAPVAVLVPRARLARLAAQTPAGKPAPQLLLTERARADDASVAVISLDHAEFQSGLKKALSIGAFFAERASKAPHPKDWSVSAFSTEYDMSATGDLGLATAGAASVIELVFAKPDGDDLR